MKRPLLCLFLLASAAAAAPAISAVYNSASYTPPGLQGSGVARGSIFVVFGAGMGPVALHQTGVFPLPVSLAGTSVEVTSGGASRQAFLLYTSARQLAAVLPSDLPGGAASMRVTYNGETSAAFSFEVVERSFGIYSINSRGNGAGVVTDVHFGVVTPASALLEGESASLWGTGLGGVPFPDNGEAQVYEPPGNVQVLVGGRPANVRYAGRAPGFAGLDQVVFDVPHGRTGCDVSLRLVVDGVTSNFTTLPIGENGSRVCSGTSTLDAADLERLFAAGSINGGALLLNRISSKIRVQIGQLDQVIEQTFDVGSAVFARYEARAVLEQVEMNRSAPGDCLVVTYQGENHEPDGIPYTGLDAGASIALNGPRGMKNLTRAFGLSGTYMAQLGGGLSLPGAPNPSPPYLDPGAYTFTGNGGNHVGPFTATVTLPPTFTWSNQDAITSVSRNSPLTITWTGGAPTDFVYIVGNSARSNPAAGASFVCTELASQGSFTVPVSILSLLPPSSGAAGGETVGLLTVGTNPGYHVPRFTAPGLDLGAIIYTFAYNKSLPYE